MLPEATIPETTSLNVPSPPIQTTRSHSLPSRDAATVASPRQEVTYTLTSYCAVQKMPTISAKFRLPCFIPDCGFKITAAFLRIENRPFLLKMTAYNDTRLFNIFNDFFRRRIKYTRVFHNTHKIFESRCIVVPVANALIGNNGEINILVFNNGAIAVN